jgi:hypothetical protein
MDDQIKLHSDRATTELDLAVRAAHPAAARAHMALSALHLHRMSQLYQHQRSTREVHEKV